MKSQRVNGVNDNKPKGPSTLKSFSSSFFFGSVDQPRNHLEVLQPSGGSPYNLSTEQTACARDWPCKEIVTKALFLFLFRSLLI